MYACSLALEADYGNADGYFKAEEPPTAILFAHAAFLSEIKGLRRKAAFWYLIAAEKLEKTGIVCDQLLRLYARC